MMKHFTNQKTKLTKKIKKNSYYNKNLPALNSITYKAFDFNNEERITVCNITMLESEPTVYIESFINDNFFRKWVSVKEGLVLKELMYDSEGLIANSK